MGLAAFTSPIYTNVADGSALASFTSEASLLGGINEQPVFWAGFFDGPGAQGKAVLLHAAGVLGTTGTPTYTFQVRASSTVGSGTLSGTSLGVSVAITGASGVTNQWWELWLRLVCKTAGQGTGNTTLTCNGSVVSYGGFAAPYGYALEPTTPPTATWTAVLDSTLNQFLNLSVTSSASSASNTLTLKELSVLALN